MKLFKPNHILLTGGAGFIGANFVRYCSQNLPQLKIVNLDKLTYAANQEVIPVSKQYTFIQGDICDASLVAEIVRKYQIDTVIHFAAESHVDRSIRAPLLFAKSNVLGTVNLLETVRQYWLKELHLAPDKCRFYHISTDEVFGSLDLSGGSATEDHHYEPRSPYAASKASADYFVRAYYHTYGLPIVMSHCSNNYGPLQHAEKFIPTVISSCFNWQHIPIYGSGENIRDWIYVEDHCRAIHAVLESGKLGESYNIGAGNEISNNELVKLICDLMDRYYPQKKSYFSLASYVADRPGHDFRYSLNTTKIQQSLNWRPQVNLQTGLLTTIRLWAKNVCEAS